MGVKGTAVPVIPEEVALLPREGQSSGARPKKFEALKQWSSVDTQTSKTKLGRPGGGQNVCIVVEHPTVNVDVAPGDDGYRYGTVDCRYRVVDSEGREETDGEMDCDGEERGSDQTDRLNETVDSFLPEDEGAGSEATRSPIHGSNSARHLIRDGEGNCKEESDEGVERDEFAVANVSDSKKAGRFPSSVSNKFQVKGTLSQATSRKMPNFRDLKCPSNPCLLGPNSSSKFFHTGSKPTTKFGLRSDTSLSKLSLPGSSGSSKASSLIADTGANLSSRSLSASGTTSKPGSPRLKGHLKPFLPRMNSRASKLKSRASTSNMEVPEKVTVFRSNSDSKRTRTGSTGQRFRNFSLRNKKMGWDEVSSN